MLGLSVSSVLCWSQPKGGGGYFFLSFLEFDAKSKILSYTKIDRDMQKYSKALL